MDDDLINRVECALLGALITDPGLVPRLEYLERHEFADDLHRTMYEAIRSLPDATAPSAGDRIAAIARAAGPPVSEEYVRELAASCPDPRHGTAYGLRLVQAALYRRMSQNADAIGAAAELLEHEKTRVVEAGANGGQQALDAARYLGLVSAALRHHTAPLASTTPATAVRSSAASPDRPASDQELREEHVLTALLQQHRESDQILGFLPAAAFTSPERQEIFRAIRRLRQADQPVDELTVSWELAIGSDSSSQRYDNSDVALDANTTIMRLARTSDPGPAPPKEARGLLSQLDRRTASGRQPARHAQSEQAPGQASPSPAAGFSATQPPKAAGPQQGREPRR